MRRRISQPDKLRMQPFESRHPVVDGAWAAIGVDQEGRRDAQHAPGIGQVGLKGRVDLQHLHSGTVGPAQPFERR
jgi:hypothetical protein